MSGVTIKTGVGAVVGRSSSPMRLIKMVAGWWCATAIASRVPC